MIHWRNKQECVHPPRSCTVISHRDVYGGYRRNVQLWLAERREHRFRMYWRIAGDNEKMIWAVPQRISWGISGQSLSCTNTRLPSYASAYDFSSSATTECNGLSFNEQRESMNEKDMTVIEPTQRESEKIISEISLLVEFLVFMNFPWILLAQSVAICFCYK